MDIARWTQRIREDMVDFRKSAKLSKKELMRSGLKKDKDGRYIVLSNKKTFIDLVDYYNEPERYDNDILVLIESLRNTITDESWRDNYLHFRLCDDDTIHPMSVIHFVFNMIMWLPMFALNVPVTKEQVFMPKTFNNKSYIDFINTKIIEPHKNLTTHNEMSQLLAKMHDICVYIAEKTCIPMGLSFSLYDLLQKWDDPEIYAICHSKVDKEMQVSEAEKFIKAQTQRLMDILLNDPEDNVLKPMIRAGQGANKKQVKDFMVNLGYKPDLAGYTIPLAANTNLLTDGLNDLKSFVVDAHGGRKASILSLKIDEAGYFQRMLCKLSGSIYLHPDPDYDCGSENYYEMNIENQLDLKDMHGRWYLTDRNTLRMLVETDYDLIGKTLKFRTPVKCASKNGICHVCYGHLYTQNYGINVGVNSALKLSEKNYQNTLSAKHALDTTSESIDLCDEFFDYFVLSDGFKVEVREDLEEFDNLELLINYNCVQKDKAELDDMEHNEYVFEFFVHNTDTDEKIKITDRNENGFYLSSTLFSQFVKKRRNRIYDEEGWISVPFSKLEIRDSKSDIFYIRLKNDELIRPLRELKKFIEKGKVLDVSGVDELIQQLRYLMKCGGIYTESIHIEIIACNLVRDKESIIDPPDWSKPNPEYQITSVHNGILMSASVIDTLTFERLKEVLSNPLTYKKRGTNFLDRVFILN
jgi:hypothetical protein